VRPGERRFAVLVGVVVTIAVLVPGVRMLVEGPDTPDGFPLSTYPMFARDRGRLVEVPTVVAVREGEVERLNPTAIAGTDQVIEASVVVGDAVRAGPAAAAALCDDVLARAGDVDEVQVVVERHDAVRWAAGDDEPDERRVVASCR
jgi:hypothetical protein